MRVTNQVSRQRRIDDILRGQGRLEESRDRVSSGLKIRRPSDAPNQIEDLLRTRSQLAELSQRRDSVDAALPSMRASEAALGDISGVLRSARTLALQAGNATISADQLQVLGDQVARLRGQSLDLANTRISGRYLFAGTHTNAVPFLEGPPATYAGNSSPLQLTLPGGALFATSETGDELLNARGATDLFRNLTDLEAAIRAGDATKIGEGLTSLDADLDNVIRLRADIGARIQYVELVRERAEDEVVAAKGRQSQLQDVDLAQAVVETKTAETAHEAALLVASRSGQTSLLDYLR